MSLTLVLKNFASRAVRKLVTDGKIRTLLPTAGSVLVRNRGSSDTLWDGFTKFGVSLLQKVWEGLGSFLSWSATAIMGMIHAAKEFIFNFNWNPSDEQLDRDIQTAFDAIPGLAGTLLGKVTGTLACGAIPGAIIFSFNEAMGVHVLKELGEEVLDDLAGAISQLIKSAFAGIGKATFAWSHKQIRTLWRESDDKFKKRLAASGLKKEEVNKALEERNKPFIIRQVIDEKVESIENKGLKAFVENFLDEFDDSCIEAGYVIAGGIDSYLAQQKVSESITQGGAANVEVSFDENNNIKLKQYKAPKII